MEIGTIITIVTLFVTFVLGLISKKITWVNNRIIPIQNLAIGLIASLIDFAITKDFSLVIATVGLGAGGAYDIINNLKKLFEKSSDEVKPDSTIES